MALHAPTDWFPQHLQNELTPGAVALMRAWLAEACRINGADWSAESLMEALASYVVTGMDAKDLGATPRDRPLLPTADEIQAAFAGFLDAAQSGEVA
jgi:hypothetical protein